MPDVSTEIAIATQTLGTATSTITFSSIPSTYTDLRLIIFGILGTGGSFNIRFNNDATSVYAFTSLYGNGTSAASFSTTGKSYISLDGDNGMGTGSTVGLGTMDVFSYNNSTKKTVLGSTSNDRNGAGSTQNIVGLWNSTSAINRIDILGATFAIGTTATLYGIL